MTTHCLNCGRELEDFEMPMIDGCMICSKYYGADDVGIAGKNDLGKPVPMESKHPIFDAVVLCLFLLGLCALVIWFVVWLMLS